jgi:hypothetical protein
MRIYFPLQIVISVTLSEESRLRVYKNRVLMKKFRPKREEMRREWRRLHNEELCDLSSTPNIFREINWRKIR